MSWISGLAGRAEELLNKVDQSAASLNTSLTNSTSDTEQKEESHQPSVNPNTWSLPTTLPSTNKLSTPTQSPKLSTPPAPITSKASKKNLDDELFEFLNSEKPVENSGKRKPHHSRQSSTGSNRSNRTTDSGLQFTARSQTPAGVQADTPSPTGQSGSSGGTSEFEVVDAVSSNTDTMMASVTSLPNEPVGPDVKALELENGLLKSEIQSLNSEMNSLLQRVKSAEHDLGSSRRNYDTLSLNASRAEQQLRDLRDRDVDNTEALKARDSQVAILRVRMSELEQEVQSKSSRLQELEKERERILQDHTDSSGLHSQALDSLKEKLALAEGQLSREKDQSGKSQQELVERQQRLVSDQQQLSETVKQLQKKLSDEKHRCENLSVQLRSSKQTSEHSQKELRDYKEKATKILQSKEKIISSLRDRGLDETGGEGIMAASISDWEQEVTILRQDLQQANNTIEALRLDVQDLETQLTTVDEEQRGNIGQLEEELSSEQHRFTSLEQDLDAKQTELSYCQEQLMTLRTSLQTRISERDEELEKLRNQLMSKKLSTATETELEQRLHALTENLIEKQTLVESLSTEKSSLKLQLERSETQCKLHEEAVNRAQTSTQIYMGEDDSLRQRGAHHGAAFLKESPTDPEFTRKVKQAANTIDRFRFSMTSKELTPRNSLDRSSRIRLGVFLRRYPIARVFVLLYMLLLHLWVMIVLLTYQPEMHGADPGAMPVPDVSVPGGTQR